MVPGSSFLGDTKPIRLENMLLMNGEEDSQELGDSRTLCRRSVGYSGPRQARAAAGPPTTMDSVMQTLQQYCITAALSECS